MAPLFAPPDCWFRIGVDSGEVVCESGARLVDVVGLEDVDRVEVGGVAVVTSPLVVVAAASKFSEGPPPAMLWQKYKLYVRLSVRYAVAQYGRVL